MAGPMEQFEIKTLVPLEVGGIDISYTNSSLYMTIAVVLTFLLFFAATRKRTMVPGRLQSFGEVLFEFGAGMVRTNAGKEGMAYFPFIFTLFLFILMGNLLGMTPYAFTYTSHIIVNFALALVIFLFVTGLGFVKHGIGYLRMFCPPGTPLPIAFVLVPIEVISYFIRPVSLSLRLFANMLGGHVLLKVLAGFVVSLGVFGVVPFVAVSAIVVLEFLVALIQAYVFALLTCVYLNDALHMH